MSTVICAFFPPKPCEVCPMMNLTPTEQERLTIFQAAEFARRHKALGVKLSHPEAVAFIADEMLLAARRDTPYADIVDMVGRLLTTDDVLPGVAAMISMVSVEGNFEEGTKMIVVFNPIGPGLKQVADHEIPGEIITPDEDIEINPGRPRITLEVVNTGDRDVQVRSHAHFFEVNRALDFDRKRAWGMRIDKPSGVGVRFEPGLAKTVDLVPLAGNRVVNGEAGLVNGPLDAPGALDAALATARSKRYRGA
jgi:urease subunit gamma/beta